MNPRMRVGMVFLCLAVPAFAFGNPSMLPKHPGYPTKGEFANDTGQRNLTAEQSRSKGAAAEDGHTIQKLSDRGGEHVVRSQDPGQVPTVNATKIPVDPPVGSAGRMTK